MLKIVLLLNWKLLLWRWLVWTWALYSKILVGKSVALRYCCVLKRLYNSSPRKSTKSRSSCCQRWITIKDEKTIAYNAIHKHCLLTYPWLDKMKLDCWSESIMIKEKANYIFFYFDTSIYYRYITHNFILCN